VGQALAEFAHLEAASVDAFEILANELSHHGAPATLVARARRAAKDETRHARMMGALATQHGAEVVRPRVKRGQVRGLEAIARENACEGCVRETYGAAVAWVQAAQARDRGVRAAMQRIARDETRHAELSWAVARWMEGALSEDARGRVAAARQRAIETLRRALVHEAPAAAREDLGLPTSERALRMLDTMRSELWAA
jgi:hypothetical protein